MKHVWSRITKVNSSTIPKMAFTQDWTLVQAKDGWIQLLKGGEGVDYGHVRSIQHILKDGKSIIRVS